MSLWLQPPRMLGEPAPNQPFSLPMPIVYERVAERVPWEYRVISVDLREEPPLGEDRLAALGAEGWLLAGTVQPPSARETSHSVIYYFIRQA